MFLDGTFLDKESNRRTDYSRIGAVQERVLLLLLGGLSLGLTRSSMKQFRIMKNMAKAWKEIGDRRLRRTIKSLYASKLVSMKRCDDGTVEMVISNKGIRSLIKKNPKNLKITPPKKWDKKWRMVLFDVPVGRNTLRDTIRKLLKSLGFVEYHHSVWVHPFPCEEEIEFIIELYQCRKYVRRVLVDRLDNSTDIMKRFKKLLGDLSI